MSEAPWDLLLKNLVDAASDAFDVGTMNFRPVVAVVLHELANHADTGDQEDGWDPGSLRDLADDIENGQNT